MHYCSPPSTMLAWGELFPVIGGAYSTFFPPPGLAMPAYYIHFADPPLADLAMGRYFSYFALPIPNFLPPPSFHCREGPFILREGFCHFLPLLLFPLVVH